MTDREPSRRQFSFSLQRLIFWVTPWAALCIVVLSAFTTSVLTPGHGIPPWHWAKLVTVAVITAVWAVLVWEDRVAIRRTRLEREADEAGIPRSPW